MIRNAPLKNYYDEVLRLVPDGSASGSVASFDDGGKDCPIKSLKVGIEPIQSGSGTPSPDNVRAISPRSSVEVYISPTTTASDGKTYTISLGQSIYGGTLDVKNGILEITHELLTVDGTADWNEYGGTGFRLYSVLPTVCTFAHGACNEFKVLSSFGDETGIVLGNNNRHLYVSSVVGSVSGVSDLATWKTFLNSSPMVFTAPTASPTTVSLSPIEIRTLYGINNLWSDSGNVEVEYKANATLLYEKIRNAIIAQGGQI